jgi:indolepyruvate ferredoxin oxidoreductase
MIRVLTAENHASAVAMAELPNGVRGYESLKLRSGQQFRADLAAALERLDRGCA